MECLLKCALSVGEGVASRIVGCFMTNLWLNEEARSLGYRDTLAALANVLSGGCCYADVDHRTLHIVRSVARLCGLWTTVGTCLDLSTCYGGCKIQEAYQLT